MYQYKFVEVPFDKILGIKKGSYFEKCKDIITLEAKNGWRLKQVVTPTNEKSGISSSYCYQIIFEKEIE